jgi:putative DNA primase/helicase
MTSRRDGFDDVTHPADTRGNGRKVVPMPPRKRMPKAPTGERTELELSEMLLARFGGELRFCAPLGGWFKWFGTHWARDLTEHSRECMKEIARDLAGEAAALLDQDTFKSAKLAGSARGVNAILDLARSAPEIVFSPDQANTDPWTLNCANGAFDLRCGELRPHNRAEIITKVCRAPYDPNAEAPTFERFLAEIQPDPEVRAYLARLIGYAATGMAREHVFAVFWGPGANGKSVFADTVSYVLGDYARPGPSSLLVSDGHRQSHPTDVASLVGTRLVLVHETKRGACFDASKVKLLTGGDKLTARHMRQDFFDFEPTHTLIMLSNYRPSADSTDHALWRRVQLVPFNVVIPEERRNPLLAEAIRGEAPGVLRWILDGARDWQRRGLAPPRRVVEQTDQYRASEDVIGQFLEERTVRLEGASVKAGVLYAAFKAWCESNGVRPVRGNDFSDELVRGRGYVRDDGKSAGRIYRGIGLRTDAEENRE